MKKLHSEVLSNVFKILLAVLVALSAIDPLGTIVYSVSETTYFDYVYNLDTFVYLFATILYYIVLVVYLVWIYRIHMDMRSLFPFFSRSPGMALACNMIPFFNVYGIPSVFIRIGRQFDGAPSTSRQGRFIIGMVAPLILLQISANVVNRLVNALDTEVSTTLLLVSGVLTTALYASYLTLCLLISKALTRSARQAVSHAPDLDEFSGTPPELPFEARA
ncbi:hypothetical protein [Cohnella cellulosilytica]|uniref:DUF4328 domain-containing protein n=1 Tax=Cohnella cellulosilytica TaxID=986710 RepID=A0ABW2FGU8_9BACL